MTNIPVKIFQTSLEKVLILNGVSQDSATITAMVMIAADLSGYPKHGTERIFLLLDAIKQNIINPKLTPQIIKESTATTVLSASFCIGQVVAFHSMNLAIEKAKKYGVGITGIINASHIGMLSFYSALASQQDCFGLVVCTSPPISVITGGHKKTFGTNPISYSFPSGTSFITADFSTTKVSRATLKEKIKLREKTHEILGVDSNGKDTYSPEEILKGGLKTFAGNIKSDMVSLLISILAGPLLGAEINHLICNTSDNEISFNSGVFFLSLDLDSF